MIQQDSDAAEIEKLVQRLYLPSNKPSEIEDLQSQLQQIQRACSWDVPDKLLGSQDQNVRFFAALTFTVKINQYGSSLEDVDLQSLLEKLLSWLIELIERRESLLVLRKLCSTLVTYFILPNAEWSLCVRHIMCCLSSGKVVPELSTTNFPSTFQLAETLSPAALAAIVMFATILAEDATRIDHASQNFDYCHKRVESNINDVTTLMRYAFELLINNKDDTQNEVMQCYLSWFSYAGEEYSDSSDQLETLRTLFVPAMKCLTLEATFERAAQFFIDLLTSRDLDLTQSEIGGFYAILTSNWARDCISDLESGNVNDAALLMAQLALALGQCIAKKLVRVHERYESFMILFHRLTVSQHFETIDQGLSNAIIDFWETYTSISPVYEYSGTEEQPIFEAAKENWLQAMEELVSGAALPTEDDGELIGLMNDDPFSEYRSRARMAIEGSYTEFEIAVFQKLVDIAIRLDADIQYYIQNNKPADQSASMKYFMGRLEFVLFCICGLSDSMEHKSGINSTEDQLLERLFSSHFFSSLISSDIQYPTKLRKRAISIIGEQEKFFGSRPQQLLAALNMLFASSKQPSFHQISALAIYKLAENNRATLTSQLGQFLFAAEQLLGLESADSLTKEYIVGAVGSIIQAHPLNEAWYNALLQICNAIQKSMDDKLQTTINLPHVADDRLTYAKEALGYLKALGKALQVPTHHHVVIDDDEEEEGDFAQIPPTLKQIQSSIVKFLEIIIGPHRQDGPILIASCDVLRTGFHEVKPGPFTFNPSVIATFVTTTPLSNPCLDVAVSTGGSFITSAISKRADAEDAIMQLTQFTKMIIANLENPGDDPDLAHACVEFVNCLAQAHLEILARIYFDDALIFFSFTIKCLCGLQLAPKRSASQVWKAMMDSQRNEERTQAFLDKTFQAVGQSLSTAFIHSFGGNATRSELNLLTEPFRKLIFSQPRAKNWIEQALFSSEFPSSRPSDADKRRFAAQVVHLRGDKRTQNVVKDFWLLCRGAPTAYG